MTKLHEKGTSRHRVAEPVQVYLVRDDRDRLERLTGLLDATKSDVLRRGLEALERQVSDPAAHPALLLIGTAERETAPSAGFDVARDHDRVLADSEIASWRPARRKPRGR
ncbi:MAG: hypothetical protein ACHQQR_05865 [Gemmatimonadales bacterium]